MSSLPSSAKGGHEHLETFGSGFSLLMGGNSSKEINLRMTSELSRLVWEYSIVLICKDWKFLSGSS